MIRTLLLNKRKLFLFFLPIFLLSAIPIFVHSGLTQAEPIGPYLNNVFPATVESNNIYEPVFPNLTFESPLAFKEVSDNRIIIGQRNGQIFWFDKSPTVTDKNILLDLRDQVGVVWDGGFLGLAVHPQFGNPGKNFIYTWYTSKDKNGKDLPNAPRTQTCTDSPDNGNFLFLTRFELNPNDLSYVIGSQTTMIKIHMYGTSHRGGGMDFGNDGFLYLSIGDQSRFATAQDIKNNLYGGVLRIDVDKDPLKSHPPLRTMPDDTGKADEITGMEYWIPNDNPFLSEADGNFEEYYSIGHRNPHRMTKDRSTGIFYIGEVGGSIHEEINVLSKGKNYGWPRYEGTAPGPCQDTPYYNNMENELPLVAFPRAKANSIIGGYVYRGEDMPELQGKYICADYGVGEEIWAVDIINGTYKQLGSFTSTDIISFGEDAQGELYILKYGVSNLFKFATPIATPPEDALPKLLSETGAFTNLTTLTPVDGLIPYDMIESFWSDGSLKKRWLAVPNDGSHDTAQEQINFSEDGDWDFPIGSVLVKHFEMPLDENNPSITKRLETRFSIKASNGEFYFLTYKWNETQTDAVLLKTGLDENIEIKKSDGSKENQVWNYPARRECIACHTSATRGTLGTRTRYLNKEFTYEKTGRTANQLITLSHIGILNQTITETDTQNFLTYKASTDPTATLDEKARSYLDLNCAYCHRPDTGNRAAFDLRLINNLAETGLFTASYNEPLGIPGEEIIVAKDPHKSILYNRINSTVPGIAMPPLSKNKIDHKAVSLIYDWINQLETPIGQEPIDNELTFIPEGVYYLENKATGKVVGVASASLNNEANVVQQTNTNLNNQKVKLTKTSLGYYKLKFMHSGKALEASSNTPGPGTNIWQNSYTGNNIQQWGFKDAGNGFYHILIRGTNLNMDVFGSNIRLYTPNTTDAQSWKLIPTEPSLLVPVTGVAVSHTTLSLFTNSTRLLVSTVSPKDATDLEVVWSSSDPAIATVDTNGKVTAVTPGRATITVTTNDGGFTAESIVTVSAIPTAVTGVSISPATVDLSVNGTTLLTATVSPADAADKGVVWSSSDATIASVDTNGKVTAISPGTATLTATTNDGGFTAQSIVMVSPIAVTGISINSVTLDLAVNGTALLTTTVSPADAADKGVVWSSSDATIASIDTNGKVTAISPGTATLTATTNDGGFTAQSIVMVSPIAVTGISINPVTLDLAVNGTALLAATVSPADAANTGVAWSSSDPAIASVDTNGKVTAISPGTATLTATTDDGGFSAQSIVTVSPIAVTGVSISPATLDLAVNGTASLTATVSPADAANTGVAWSSSDATIASVGTNGKVTAISPGTATLTATTLDGGHAAQSIVTVFPIAVTGVSISPATLDLVVNGTALLAATVSPTDAANKGVAWSSSDPTTASVDTNGKVTAISAGTATLTAMTLDGGHAARSIVTVSPIAVTGVSINPATLDLAVNGTALLTATVSPADAANPGVTWSSSDPKIASVDTNGKVTAVSAGTATLTASTLDGGHAAQSIITVLTPPLTCITEGTILMQRYNGINGTQILHLLNAPNYPNNPSLTLELNSFEIPTNNGNNYGVHVSGTLCAPETGTYYFWIAGDDSVELNLSTDAMASNKQRIAHHNGLTSSKEWNKYTIQKSVGINLIAGNKYYIEALMKEGSGNDNLAVGWRKPSDGNGANPISVIPGNNLSPVAAATDESQGEYVPPTFTATPNPASEVINVQLKNLNSEIVEYNIYSILGLRITQRRGTPKETFYVDHLPKGVYIITAHYEGGYFKRKIVIK